MQQAETNIKRFSPLRLIALWIVLFVLGGVGNLMGQTTFSWNSGTYGGTGTNRTFTGNAVSGVAMTATIVNSEDVWQESSPKWIASGSTSTLGTGCAGLPAANQGLLLSTNWTANTTKTITTTISFSSPVRGPVRFSLYDLNDNGFGQINERVEVSAISASSSSLLISRTDPTCVQNGGGTVTGINSTTLILNSGNSSSCTCWGNNEVVVGSSSDCISTITIRYRSMSGSNNNPAQYIVISNLTGTIQSVTAPTGITGTTTICSGSSTTLTATGGSATSQWFTGLCGGTLVGTGASITVSPTSATTYFVRNVSAPCGFSSCVSTTVNATSNPSSITASSNSPLCNNSTINLTGSATNANSYSWEGPNSFTSSTQNPSIANATSANSGTYFFYPSNSGGCNGGVNDDFSDNDFTNKHLWTVKAGQMSTGIAYLQGTNLNTDEYLSTPSNQTYGSWQFDFQLATTSNVSSNEGVRLFLSAQNDNLPISGMNGYYVRVGTQTSNNVQLFNTNSTSSIITFTWTPNLNWNTVRITRSSTNRFDLYFNGVLVGSVTDGTWTTSNFVLAYLTGGSGSTNHIIDNIICRPGISTEVVVMPPAVRVNTGPQCSGTTLNFSATDLPGSTFSWSVTPPTGLTASPTSGTASTFSTTLSNTTTGNINGGGTPYVSVTQTINGVSCVTTFSPNILANPVASISTPTLNVCNTLTSGSLGGNTPPAGTGAWSIVSGPSSGSFSASTSPTSTFTANTYGTYVLRWTVSNAPCADASATVTVNFTPNIDFANTQFPTSATICTGGSQTIYGKIFINGVTVNAGATAGLVAELGYSTTNSNPNTWTNWQAASFNAQVVNDDEYVATLTGLVAGTYYYAFRYSYNGCAYTYGGTGGIWSSNSGVLTVNDCFGTYASAPNLTSCNTSVASQGAFYNTSGSGANLINSTGTNYNNYNFGSYFVNSGGLVLKGAELKTWRNTSSGNVCSAKMYYSIYPTGSPTGVFTPINLPYYDGCSGGAFPTGGPCNNGDQKWRDISQNINLTNYTAGSYTLEVYYEITGSHTSTSGCGTTQYLNNNGSNYTSTFTLLAAPTASNTGPYCEGTGTVSLSASNGGTSYSWSGPNSFASSIQNPSNGTPSSSNAGTYTVTVNVGGCTQTVSTSVVVNPAASVLANSNSPFCAGQAINLTATDGFSTYAWSGPNSFSNATQNPSISNAQAVNAGTYTLTVTDGNGCQATSSTVVSLTTSPTAANNGPVCVGGALSLSTNSASSYSWSGPNSFTSSVQNPTVSASATTAMAGTYTVSVIGSCAAATGVVDNFSDGNFTANPVWTVQAGGFVQPLTYLEGNDSNTDDVISTPSTQAYGTWQFDYSFQPASTNQNVRFFLISNTAGLTSSNGYYIWIDGNNTNPNNLQLRKLNNGTPVTLINTTWSPIGTAYRTIKVIRNLSGQFELFLNGISQGTFTDNTYTTSSYLGVWNTGLSISDNHRIDNITCSPAATATTTVVVNSGPSISNKTGTICSGGTYTLATASPDVVPVGTTYSWTFTANPNITGAATGTTQSSFAQTLTNTSSMPQTIVYSVTPTVGSCSGTPFTITITVDAPLNGGTVTTDQTICAGGTPTTLTSVLLPSGGSGLGITGSVQIGTQIWMNSNLNVVNYNDGTPVGTDFTGTAGAYTWYDNSYPTWGQYYGALYNWYAVNTGKLCPSDWHVPTQAEWNTLINYVGNNLNAGKKLKSCRTVNFGCPTTQDPRWNADNTTFGTDDFNFSAFPAGRAYLSSGNLLFERVRERTRFWASTQNDVSNGDTYEFNELSSGVTVFNHPKNEGYSVRCMGDNATTIQNSYTYQWQQSVGCNNVWTDIPLANSNTYSPGALTQTTCFRRMITDACGTAYSNTITITVTPGPVITPMTATICSGQTFSVTPVNGTNGIVPDGTTYTWSVPVISPASSITGGSAQATAQSTISQTLINTTTSNATASYTVTATSGSCNYTFTVTVTVLPPIVPGVVQGISSNSSGPGHLVIYQAYGGGLSAGATYTNDFVVLYNPTANAVNLSGWSLQYASASGSGWGTSPSPLSLSGNIQSGGYFLVKLDGNATGATLPTFDLSGTISMNATNAKIALVNSLTPLSGTCPSGGSIVDFVGYGSTANCSEGSSTITGLNATNWATRKLNGCQDTDINSADFTPGNTIAPKSSASPTNFCTTTSLTETICANATASSIIATAATGSSGSFTYQWYSQEGNVPCPTGSSTTGWTLIPGETNLTYAPGIVTSTTTYALYVTATGTNNCGGLWSTDCRKVVVNPAPIVTDVTTSVCSGSAFTGTPINGTNGTVPTGTTYTWSAPSGSNFTGGAAGSGASTINGTLTLSSGSSATAVYTVTPSLGSCSGNTFTVTVSLTNCAPPVPFTACNLVVYEVGNNTSLDNNAFPVSVKEITPNGANVQTISNAFLGTNLLTQNGVAESVGLLNSYNGFLSVSGYSVNTGTALNISSPVSAALINKVNTILDGNGLLQSYTSLPTTAPIPFSGNHIRSTLATGGNTFYATGNGGNDGLYFYNGTTFSQLVSANARGLEIFNNQLYISTVNNVFQVGTGLPTTGTQTTTALLPTYSNPGIYDFSISPDGCTMYVADNGSNVNYRGVSKYKLVGGTWTYQYNYQTWGIGLVVDYSGTNDVVYVTTANNGSSAPNKIEKLIDNPTGNNFTVVTTGWPVTPANNNRFAGIDFTPNSTTAITNPITTQPVSTVNLCNTQTQTLSVTHSGSATYQWYSNSVNSICGATPISGAINATYTPPATGVDGTVYYFVKVAVNCYSIFTSTISAVITTITTTPTATNNSPFCSGENNTLTLQTPTVSGATYSWTGPNSFASSSQNPTVTTNASSIHQGTYSVTISVNGCTSLPGTTLVTIYASPSVIFLSPP
jgi:uncharacterized protein (TIGR02145 family)